MTSSSKCRPGQPPPARRPTTAPTAVETAWESIEKGATIGGNYETTFDPVTSNKFRLFINQAGCININYFGLKQNKRELTSVQGDINYDWHIPADLCGDGYFTVEKDGMLLSQSELIHIASLTSNPTNLSGKIEMVFFQDKSIRVISPKEKPTNYKVWDTQGILLRQGTLSQGETTIPMENGGKGLLLIQIGENNYKVMAE